MVNSGVGAAPALLIGLVLGFVAGGLNGILITLIKLPPFIATLGTMSVYQGVYGLSGALAALAGLVVVARISAAQSEAGAPYLLTAIAAAVIGGANLMGGEGRIAGTLVGALILGALTNGLVLLNVPSFYEQIVTGLVVVIAVAIDQGSKHDWWGLSRGRGRPAEPTPVAPSPSAAEATVGSRTGE